MPDDLFRLLKLQAPIDEDTSKTWRTLNKFAHRRSVIQGLGEGFEVKFAAKRQTFDVADGSDLFRTTLEDLYLDPRSRPILRPYKGTQLPAHTQPRNDV